MSKRLVSGDRLDKKGLYSAERFDCLERLANILCEVGAWSAADEAYKEVLVWRESVYISTPEFLESAIDLGRTLSNIGDLKLTLNQLTDSEMYYSKALQIEKRVLKDQPHLSLAFVYYKLGLVSLAKKDYVQAEAYHLKCLEIRQIYGQRCAGDISDSMNCLGTIYNAQGQANKSLEYYQQALGVKRSLSAEKNSQNTAVITQNIANIYGQKHDYKLAITYHSDALSIRKKLYKGSFDKESGLILHHEVANSYFNIGVIYNCMGESDLAIYFLEIALKIRKSVFDASNAIHQDLLDNTAALARVYLNSNHNEQSILLNKELLVLYSKKAVQDGVMRAANTNANIAVAYSELEQYALANLHAEKAIKIYQASVTENADNIKRLKSLITQNCIKAGNNALLMNDKVQAIQFYSQTIPLGTDFDDPV